jgi:hypothetical protein
MAPLHDEGDMYGPFYGVTPGLNPRAPLPLEVSSVPCFYGDGKDVHDARHWLDILDEYALMWNWTEEARVRVARTRLLGRLTIGSAVCPVTLVGMILRGNLYLALGKGLRLP